MLIFANYAAGGQWGFFYIFHFFHDNLKHFRRTKAIQLESWFIVLGLLYFPFQLQSINFLHSSYHLNWNLQLLYLLGDFHQVPTAKHVSKIKEQLLGWTVTEINLPPSLFPAEGFHFVFQFEMTLTIFWVSSKRRELFRIAHSKDYSQDPSHAPSETHHNSGHLTFNCHIKSK